MKELVDLTDVFSVHAMEEYLLKQLTQKYLLNMRNKMTKTRKN